MTRRLLWMVVCCLPFVSGCKQSECAISETAIDDTIYQNLPFEMPKVQQPVFPAYEVNISKFGAKGDGMTLNTKAINDAIIQNAMHWYSSPVTLKHILSFPLLSKDWKHAAVNHRFLLVMPRISLSQDMEYLTVTETAGVR